MSETPTPTPTPTPLEQSLLDMRAFFTRLKEGPRAKQPVTNEQLANVMLNSIAPLFEETRKEYNEGFAAVEELGTGAGGDDDDDDDDGDVAQDLATIAMAGKNLVVKLATLVNVLLDAQQWLDPATPGQLVATAPEPIRAAYAEVFGLVNAYAASTQNLEEMVDALNDADDDADEDDEDADFTEEERNWKPGGGL